MPTLINKTIGTASRDFSTLQAWEDNQNDNMVSADELHQGTAFKDSKFTAAVTFSGGTSDATRFIRFTVDPADRQDGTAGSGVEVELNGATLRFSSGEDFNTVQFLECHNTGTSSVNIEGDLGHANQVGITLTQLIVHGGSALFSTSENSTHIMFNIIAYDAGAANGWTSPGSSTNHECYNIALLTRNSGGRPGFSGMLVKNCIGAEATASDFVNSGTGSDFNTSEDGSAPGGNSLINQSVADDIKWLNTTVGSEDLHIASDSAMIDQGTDISANIPSNVSSGTSVDIDEETRPSGAEWDIGPDEFVEAAGGSGIPVLGRLTVSPRLGLGV